MSGARRIIAIGGGKGGAGKSLIAANVGIFLATIGKRVVLLDFDPGGANLHAFVGCERPVRSRLIVETAVPGLGLAAEETPDDLDADYLVVDLGPGSGSTVVDELLGAHVGVLVVLPEPTAVESTWRFIKSALGRRADFRPCVVVNQVRTRADEELGPAMVQAARRRLGLGIDYLGHLDHDDAVWLAVRKRRPLLVEHPDSLAAKGIERVTRRLLQLEGTEPVFHPPAEQTHYEALDLEPGATAEEIRRAYRRARETYASDSIVVRGLDPPERLAELHRRFEEAYEVLMDAEKRRAYDLSVFPDGIPTPPPEERRRVTPAPGVPVVPAAPPEPELDPDVPITGAFLRQLREARGIDLHVVSQKTKIGVGHLRAIEDERFDLLPALVYVRGFLQEYAKALRLDVRRVLATYLERVRAAKEERNEGDRSRA